MMRIHFRRLSILLLSTLVLSGQNNIDELHGDRKFRKQGLHNGNQVETLFWNFGEVGWWGKMPSGVWPRGTNHSYMDGIYPLVAAEVVKTNGDTIHIVEGGYREHYESGPTGIEYGWQPLPGLTAPNQDFIAMSDDPTTWPPFWPDRPAEWGGKWNGYFGQRMNADQESYFVMDDYQDHGSDFYGQFNCDSTDLERGGLGMRVAVRGFQWANVLAEDIIFWHYDITNVSTTLYPKAVFGMYADAGVGGQNDSNDDIAYYDLTRDMAYTWDSNGMGSGGWPTGYAGYAFLESPGNQFDGIDNDDDAAAGPGPILVENDFQPHPLPDEVVIIDYNDMSITNNYGRQLVSFSAGGSGPFWSFNGDQLTLSVQGQEYSYVRGNTVSEKPFNGFDDDLDGLIDENANVHIGLKYRNWLTGAGFDNAMIDESRDDGIDNDGDWDQELDDVGKDGLGGTGDLGEGDGLPTPGEPNFDATDKDESDQIGLTAFDSFFIGQGVEFRYDEAIWERIANYHFDSGSQNGNIAFLFGSGPFIMPPGHTERFSLALVFGENLADLRRNKEIVQDIYNANYNFARPPIKPTVTVVPGNQQVTLYWDNLAEASYDEFADPVTGGYDFEGYKIYKATDAAFNDAYVISNGYGEATFYSAAAQYDLINGVKDFFGVDVHGIKYFLGDDTGLRHSWTDTDVINGKTYYYAVVSYDRGWPDKYILPSECTKLIVTDIYGNVALDKNTVSVIPNAPTSGYLGPEIPAGIEHISGPGTGDVLVDIIDPTLVTASEYLISFDDTTHQDSVTYSMIEINTDTTAVFVESTALNNEDSNPIHQGLRLRVQNDAVAYNDSASGWISGVCNLDFYAEKFDYWTDFSGRIDGFPAAYEVRVGVPDSSFLFSNFKYTTNFQVWDVTHNRKVRFYLWEPSTQVDSLLTDGDYIRLWLKNGNSWRETWKIYMVAPEGSDPIQPAAGDVARIAIDMPFRSGDQFHFITIPAEENRERVISNLSQVAVVPNPYVAAAIWEPPRYTSSGRGERRLYFIHLPSKATIRIYTMSGDLVNTLHHESSIDNGALAWDMLTRDGMDLAPGVYAYHVDANELGQTTGKFAVIK